MRDEVSKEVQRLHKLDVIKPITASGWMSPIVVARKKDGKISLCVDLGAPHQAMIPDCFASLSTEEPLNSMAGAKWFSKIGLASSYRHLPSHEDSRDNRTQESQGLAICL